MRWALLLARLAAMAMALPAQPGTAAPGESDSLDQLQYPDFIAPSLLAMVPAEERLKPDFNFWEWSHNATQSGVATGWTSYLEGNSQHLPWPRGRNSSIPNLVEVPYCFDDPDTKSTLQVVLADAIWKGRYVTTDPGKSSKHALKMKQLTEYCLDYQNPADPKPWNPKVPIDTLRIWKPKGGQDGYNAATIGYLPEDKITTGGILNLRIGQQLGFNRDEESGAVLHELGHVFGMGHEHQRMDRDKYVQVRCDKIAGYAAAKAEVLRNNEDPAKLCTDILFALKYKFYMVQDFWLGDPYLREISTSDYYGYGSIMQYGSNRGADNKECADHPDKLKECPLVQYVNYKNHDEGVRYIKQVTTTIFTEKEWFEKYYPWDI